LAGILFVLRTGLPWEDLPQELGCGSGMTCWRRLRDWQKAGVFDRLQTLILARLEGAGCLDWSRAVMDASLVRARGVKKGGSRPGRTRRTAPARRRSATSSPTGRASRSPH
jgi:transposase